MAGDELGADGVETKARHGLIIHPVLASPVKKIGSVVIFQQIELGFLNVHCPVQLRPRKPMPIRGIGRA